MTKTHQELKKIFERLGLEIPEIELCDVASAVRFIDEMKTEVRKLHSSRTEPAHTVSFPEAKR